MWHCSFSTVLLLLVDPQCIPGLLTLGSCLHCPVIYSLLNAVTQLLIKARPWCSPNRNIHKSQHILDAWYPQIHQRWAQHGFFSVKKTASLEVGFFYFVCLWCWYSVGRIALFFLLFWKEGIKNCTPRWLCSVLELGEGERNVQLLEGEAWTDLEGLFTGLQVADFASLGPVQLDIETS